ncbi:hypothetical protein [Rhodovulum adriaticum]|nr:hypothetical protein [Rhodovulum adriaticum]
MTDSADPSAPGPGGLLIHIGSQKTGSTALQNFLSANETALAGRGLRFLATGRRNISHNSLFRPLRGPDAAAIWADVAAEVAAHPDTLSIMSSENFFDRDIAAAMARHMPAGLRGACRVVAYARRQDAYLEAMYKQKTKNGREHLSPLDFVAKVGDEIADYRAILGAFADVIGDDAVILRRFERRALKNGDVIADFLGVLGLNMADADFVQPERDANQTLSRAVTEQMGALARHTKINVRELAREMILDPDGAPRRSRDVFTKGQCLQIMAHFADGNAAVCKRFIKDDDGPLFDMADLAPDAPDRYPPPQEELALYAQAQERIAAAIGRIERRNRARLFRG